MKKRNFAARRTTEFIDEPEEWLRLTPRKRIEESSKLWQIYLALGGSLDPEPDPQSPFDFLYEDDRQQRRVKER